MKAYLICISVRQDIGEVGHRDWLLSLKKPTVKVDRYSPDVVEVCDSYAEKVVTGLGQKPTEFMAGDILEMDVS